MRSACTGHAPRTNANCTRSLVCSTAVVSGESLRVYAACCTGSKCIDTFYDIIRNQVHQAPRRTCGRRVTFPVRENRAVADCAILKPKNKTCGVRSLVPGGQLLVSAGHRVRTAYSSRTNMSRCRILREFHTAGGIHSGKAVNGTPPKHRKKLKLHPYVSRSRSSRSVGWSW